MRLRLLLSLVVAVPLVAQDLRDFEKILVPVLHQSAPIAGANGSQFVTSFGVLPAGVEPITYYPHGDEPAIGQSRGDLLEVLLWSAPVVAKGRFVFVHRDDASRPMFASVVAMNAQGERSRTPLPVVRERDALRGPSTFGLLPNIPIYEETAGPNTARFLGYTQRHTLRVYDFSGRGDLVVAVRQRWAAWPIRGVVSGITLPVNRRDFDHPSYPYYAEIDLGTSLPDWCQPGLRGQCGSFDAIVEVEPLTPDARYYAFISTTDNLTQHVAIYTPR